MAANIQDSGVLIKFIDQLTASARCRVLLCHPTTAAMIVSKQSFLVSRAYDSELNDAQFSLNVDSLAPAEMMLLGELLMRSTVKQLAGVVFLVFQ